MQQLHFQLFCPPHVRSEGLQPFKQIDQDLYFFVSLPMLTAHT